MTLKTTKLRDAITFALVSGATVLAGTGVAFAQDSSEQQATTLDRIEVTGSRIKRAEVEGPNPITVISRADMDAAGEISVADFLRNNVYNSFGSTREASGSATGSQATISLRGLGSAYTLVLLDGRRMTTSAALDGGAANINMIPTSAVERIEILREGAGAVYGSDAIGGVVNVILRKDYEGLTIMGGVESPKVGPNGNVASVAGGISSDRGNITFVLDHQEREMMYNRDIRSIVEGAGLPFALSGYNSAANFVSPTTGTVGVPGCDQFENSYITNPDSNTCGFDHGATSANESSLNRDAMLLNGNYDLTENTSLFFRALASNTQSLGVYAAAPVDTHPTISADNPFNPFGVDGELRYRFTPLGTRDTIRKDTMREYTVGLRGITDWFGGADWQIAAGHGDVAQSSVNYNYGIHSTLQQLIDAGQYNPFDPTHPSVAAAAPLVGHTVYVESVQRTFSVDGNIGFDLFDIGDRPVGFVTGFEYRDDRLNQTYDAQSAAGNVFGSAGAGTNGERSYYAVYFESLFPILDTFSVTLAGRYDSYNDLGSKFSPRVSLEFRPIDSLLVRGSWGKGFRAPTLVDLYQAPATTNLNSANSAAAGVSGGDALACAALTAARQDPTVPDNYQPYPTDPCSTSLQWQWLVQGNPDLQPEESENWGVGLVWSPTDAMSFAVDYYDIEIENVIGSVPRALAFHLGNEGEPYYGVERGGNIIAPNGDILPGPANQILLPTVNGSFQTVRGVDFEGMYRFDTESMGSFTTRLSWSHMLEYDLLAVGTTSALELAGTAGYPEDRAQLTLGWDSGDFAAAAIANYIGDSSDGEPELSLPSQTTWDLQGSIKLPWNGKVTLGVRNVGNKMPPLNGYLYGFPYYDNTIYNIWGRTPYIRYEQNF